MRALATLLLMPILVLASAAAAESPEGGDDWRWSEEPRNAHIYEQDFGQRVTPAKSAEKESGTSSAPIGERRSSGFDTLLQSRSGTATQGSTSSIRDIGVSIFTLSDLKSLCCTLQVDLSVVLPMSPKKLVEQMSQNIHETHMNE